MKTSILLIFMLIITSSSKSVLGVYIYTQNHYYESIELQNRGEFVYTLRKNFSEYKVNGNYNISCDSLFLNSYPQKDRMIVIEKNRKNRKKSIFVVQTKEKLDFYYNLHLILEDGNVIILEDQIGKSKIKNIGIRKFYIIDKNGIRSPDYLVKGTANNYFEILFETNRVFENESWPFISGKIKPRDFSGNLTNYFLKKYN